MNSCSQCPEDGLTCTKSYPSFGSGFGGPEYSQLYLLSPEAIPHSPYQTQDCGNTCRVNTNGSPGPQGKTSLSSRKHPSVPTQNCPLSPGRGDSKRHCEVNILKKLSKANATLKNLVKHGSEGGTETTYLHDSCSCQFTGSEEKAGVYY